VRGYRLPPAGLRAVSLLADRSHEGTSRPPSFDRPLEENTALKTAMPTDAISASSRRQRGAGLWPGRKPALRPRSLLDRPVIRPTYAYIAPPSPQLLRAQQVALGLLSSVHTWTTLRCRMEECRTVFDEDIPMLRSTLTSNISTTISTATITQFRVLHFTPQDAAPLPDIFAPAARPLCSTHHRPKPDSA